MSPALAAPAADTSGTPSMQTLDTATDGKRPRRSAGPLAVLAGLAAFFLSASSPTAPAPAPAPVPAPDELPFVLSGNVPDQDLARPIGFATGWLGLDIDIDLGGSTARAETSPTARGPKSKSTSNAKTKIESKSKSKVGAKDASRLPDPTRRPRGTSDRSILSGGGPSTTVEPVDRPFFLGWSADVGSGRKLVKPTFELGGATVDPRSGWVYVATRDGKLICLVEGVRRWEAELGAPALAPPAVHPEVVVVGVSNGILHTFNKVTGERLSRVLLEEELITRPVVVRTPKGLRAFVGSSAESLFAADIELGRKLWRLHRDAPPGFTVRGFAAPVVTDTAVFAAHADGVVSAVEPESGAVLWERRVSPPGEQVDVDSLATDGSLLFVASYSGGVLALRPDSGSTAWRVELPRAHHVLYDDGHLVAVAPERVISLQPENGAVRWNTALSGIGGLSHPVVGPGLLAVTESAGAIHFIALASGRHVGAFAPGGGFSSPPSVAGSTLFALSNGGRVYGLGLLAP